MIKVSESAQGEVDFNTIQATPAAKRVDRGTLRNVAPTAARTVESEAVPRAFADGQRVRVKIRDRAQFSGDAGARMDGRHGAVERHSAVSYNGDPPPGPAYLVRFDEPVAGWHAHQSEVTSFWFPPGDMEAL